MVHSGRFGPTDRIPWASQELVSSGHWRLWWSRASPRRALRSVMSLAVNQPMLTAEPVIVEARWRGWPSEGSLLPIDHQPDGTLSGHAS